MTVLSEGNSDRRAMPGAGVVSALGAIIAVGALALLASGPPDAREADTPEREFSAARAQVHVAEIAQRPHPLGTQDNARVRRYITDAARALGAEVRTETGEAVLTDRGNPFRVAAPHNVVARIPGTAPERSGGKAVLVVAHYDSVPTGPGAADDAAAVGAMLETMRALRAAGGVPNDVEFLFTDGEEVGLLGATLFAAQHDIGDYGVVLNWEARGSSGPMWMFETSQGNGQLIEVFAEASPRPIANSLSYEVYQRLPNDTDFTVFRAAHAPGLNAAFIEGLHDYHSTLDTPERLSADSLEHHGQTMLALVHQFGGADLRALAGGGDAIYFDVFARVLVRYPAWLVLPLALVSVAGLTALVAVGARRSRLRPLGVLTVAGVGLAAMLVAGLLCVALWRVALLLRPGLASLPLTEPYQQAGFSAGFAVVALAVLLLAVRVLRGRSRAELAAGGLSLFAVLLLGCVLTVPGGSFLLQWPLLAGLPALWWETRADRDGPPLAAPVLHALGPLVAAVLFSPLVANLVVALGVRLAGVGMVFAVLAGVALLPLLASLPRTGWQAAGAGLAALAVLTTSLLVAGFDEQRPRPNALLYVRDLAEGSTLWVTGDPEPDEWTRRVLGDRPGKADAVTYLPHFAGRQVLTGPAPAIELPPPEVRVLADTTSGDTRSVRLNASSRRGAWQLQVRLPAEPLRSCTVAGRQLDADQLQEGAQTTRGVVFYYFGAAEGLELACDVPAGMPLQVEVCDLDPGLGPQVEALTGARPAGTIPVSYGLGPSDSTVVRQMVTV
jgi:hypothetical protein